VVITGGLDEVEAGIDIVRDKLTDTCVVWNVGSSGMDEAGVDGTGGKGKTFEVEGTIEI